MNESDLKVATGQQTGEFNPEQKRYLEGLVAGLQIAKAAKSVAGAVAPAADGRSGERAPAASARRRF